MDRYQKLFKKLKNKHEGAFVPFVVIGDPNKKISLSIIDALIDSGCDALELGFPFSDPIADGPTIQKASLRSLNSGININECFNIILNIRKKYSNIPIGVLVYANLVFNKGIDNFYSKCSNIGIDSILIPDLPIEESKFFLKFADHYHISQIFICPPNADDKLIYKISSYSKGYTYLASRLGITGTENKANIPLIHIINKLKKYYAPPILQGFGVSETQHISIALKSGLSGSISGSAIVDIIENNLNNVVKMINRIKNFVKKMKQATLLNNNIL